MGRASNTRTKKLKKKKKKIANEFEKVDSGMRSRRREHTSTK